MYFYNKKVRFVKEHFNMYLYMYYILDANLSAYLAFIISYIFAFNALCKHNKRVITYILLKTLSHCMLRLVECSGIFLYHVFS